MKRNWRRGLLLGVSVALLLSGGVALAAQSISLAPWCEVCCPYIPSANADAFACDPYRTITSDGWGAWESLDLKLIPPGTKPPLLVPDIGKADGAGKFELYLGMACYGGNEVREGPDVSQTGLILFADWHADDYGKWGVRLKGQDGAVVKSDFKFAEKPGDCLEVEFVPEPGSIMLLGSGLAGLAGYATLRWRARE